MVVAEAARAPRTSVRALALSEGALAWMVVVTSAFFIGGVYLDGWAHNHGKVDNTFFTPWHAVLYSGYGATAGVLFAALMRNHAAGLAWRRALPQRLWAVTVRRADLRSGRTGRHGLAHLVRCRGVRRSAAQPHPRPY